MITTATTQQQPAFSCFSEKNEKKNKKWLLRLHSHIHIPTGHHVNFTVLTLVELYRRQETDRGRCWWRKWTYAGRTAWGRGSGGKKNVCWQETCRRRNWRWMFFSFQFSHLEEVHALILWVLENFCFQLVVKLWYFDVNRYGPVCLKVTECLFSDWWDGREKRKVKGEKPSLRRAVA